jgi:hypothetical protein
MFLYHKETECEYPAEGNLIKCGENFLNYFAFIIDSTWNLEIFSAGATILYFQMLSYFCEIGILTLKTRLLISLQALHDNPKTFSITISYVFWLKIHSTEPTIQKTQSKLLEY